MRRNLLILAYLAVQLLLPLRYYAGGNEFDERFAWRMFSPIRVTPCVVRFTEVGLGQTRVPVSPSQHVQIAWIELMQRARVDVVRAYAGARCAEMRGVIEHPGMWVDLQCEHPDGTIHRPISSGENLCEPPP